MIDMLQMRNSPLSFLGAGSFLALLLDLLELATGFSSTTITSSSLSESSSELSIVMTLLDLLLLLALLLLLVVVLFFGAGAAFSRDERLGAGSALGAGALRLGGYSGQRTR